MLKLAMLLLASGGAYAAEPIYTLSVRFDTGYRPEVPVRVNGSGPLWCTFDSGAGAEFLLNSGATEAAGLHPTGSERSFGEGPVSTVDRIVPDVALSIGKLRLPHQRIRLGSLKEQCIVPWEILSRFVVEIDYLSPEIRLYAANAYRPPPRTLALPLEFDGSGRPMVVGRLTLQAGDVLPAHLLLDTASAEYDLALTKVFTDSHQILKRVNKVIQPPFHAESGGNIDLLATRIARLSLGPVGVVNPVVMLFRTPRAARGRLPDGLLGSSFLRRFLVAINASNRLLYLTPNRTYSDRPQQWWWSAPLPFLPQ